MRECRWREDGNYISTAHGKLPGLTREIYSEKGAIEAEVAAGGAAEPASEKRHAVRE